MVRTRLRLLPLALVLGACDAITGSDEPDRSVASIVIEPDSVRLGWGTETRLNVTARNASGRALDVPGPVAWASSDTSVAVVSDSGTVTARAAGQATVTATVGGMTDQAKVVVPYPYTLVALEGIAGMDVHGTAVNDLGQAVGYAWKSGTTSTRALLWDSRGMTILGEGRANDINSRGQVVGASPVESGSPYAASTAVLWEAGNRTLLLSPSVSQSLGGSTAANAINDAGDVVVSWRPAVTGSGGRYTGTVYRLRGGTLQEIVTATNAEGYGINEAGWITGAVGSLAHLTLQGFLWRDGQITYIGQQTENATAVNATGQVVGGAYRAYLWRDGTTVFGIPADSAGRIPFMSEAGAINDRGDVVGWMNSAPGPDPSRAFVWPRGGRPTDLNRLLPAGDWIFLRATDVNEKGQIVGWGKHRTTGEVRALLATPVP